MPLIIKKEREKNMIRQEKELGLKSSVADLDLSTRSFNCLYKAGIYRIEDLINLDLNQL